MNITKIRLLICLRNNLKPTISNQWPPGFVACRTLGADVGTLEDVLGGGLGPASFNIAERLNASGKPVPGKHIRLFGKRLRLFDFEICVCGKYAIIYLKMRNWSSEGVRQRYLRNTLLIGFTRGHCQKPRHDVSSAFSQKSCDMEESFLIIFSC